MHPSSAGRALTSVVAAQAQLREWTGSQLWDPVWPAGFPKIITGRTKRMPDPTAIVRRAQEGGWMTPSGQSQDILAHYPRSQRGTLPVITHASRHVSCQPPDTVP